MNNPQIEAISILDGALKGLFAGNADLKSVLRRCAHACQILGWTQQLIWFQNELNGYPNKSELPWYRKSVKGLTKWLVDGGIYTVLDSVIENGYSAQSDQPNYTDMDVWAGIDWVLSAAQSGYSEPTGRKSSKYIKFRDKNVETKEMNTYDKHVFQAIIMNIENEIFNFASSSYAILRYGDTMQDIWQAYRVKVEEHLIPLGFGKHLDAIRNGLNSQNPQEWRNAMWSCRDIFHDLAIYLWRDKRDTYDHLPGQGKNGKLRVTEKDYVNRLGAYLHQKRVTGKSHAYLRSEMERIYNSIATLNELSNKAHAEITLFDAHTTVIGTYIILGEIVTRTDMNPVTEYCNPEALKASDP